MIFSDMTARSAVCPRIIIIIMNLLLFLGDLRFCLAAATIASTDPSVPFGLLDGGPLENCTECSIKSTTSCFCIKVEDGFIEGIDKNLCPVCCKGEPACCYCDDCSICLNVQIQLTTMTHISIFILFAIGLTGILIIYCKICKKYDRSRRRERWRRRCNTSRTITLSDDNLELENRPPRYSTVCGAPPLYSAPYNSAAMEEAPPSYPSTPRLNKRKNTDETTCDETPDFVTHHI